MFCKKSTQTEKMTTLTPYQVDQALKTQAVSPSIITPPYSYIESDFV